MAKNYATIYGAANDSISLEQRVYAKLETSRGIFVTPDANEEGQIQADKEHPLHIRPHDEGFHGLGAKSRPRRHLGISSIRQSGCQDKTEERQEVRGYR